MTEILEGAKHEIFVSPSSVVFGSWSNEDHETQSLQIEGKDIGFECYLVDHQDVDTASLQQASIIRDDSTDTWSNVSKKGSFESNDYPLLQPSSSSSRSSKQQKKRQRKKKGKSSDRYQERPPRPPSPSSRRDRGRQKKQKRSSQVDVTPSRPVSPFTWEEISDNSELLNISGHNDIVPTRPPSPSSLEGGSQRSESTKSSYAEGMTIISPCPSSLESGRSRERGRQKGKSIKSSRAEDRPAIPPYASSLDGGSQKSNRTKSSRAEDKPTAPRAASCLDCASRKSNSSPADDRPTAPPSTTSLDGGSEKSKSSKSSHAVDIPRRPPSFSSEAAVRPDKKNVKRYEDRLAKPPPSSEEVIQKGKKKVLKSTIPTQPPSSSSSAGKVPDETQQGADRDISAPSSSDQDQQKKLKTFKKRPGVFWNTLRRLLPSQDNAQPQVDKDGMDIKAASLSKASSGRKSNRKRGFTVTTVNDDASRSVASTEPESVSSSQSSIYFFPLDSDDITDAHDWIDNSAVLKDFITVLADSNKRDDSSGWQQSLMDTCDSSSIQPSVAKSESSWKTSSVKTQSTKASTRGSSLSKGSSIKTPKVNPSNPYNHTSNPYKKADDETTLPTEPGSALAMFYPKGWDDYTLRTDQDSNGALPSWDDDDEAGYQGLPLMQARLFESGAVNSVNDFNFVPDLVSNARSGDWSDGEGSVTHVKTGIWQITCYEEDGTTPKEPFYVVTGVSMQDLVDTKKLRKALFGGEKFRPKIAMAPTDVAEELVGFKSGTMAPICHSTPMKLFLEETIINNILSRKDLPKHRVNVGSGKKGKCLSLSADKFLAIARDNPKGIKLCALIQPRKKQPKE